MMHVRFRAKLNGGHWHVRVFVGPSRDQTLALAGTLVLRLDELEPIRAALASAPFSTFDLIDEDAPVTS